MQQITFRCTKDTFGYPDPYIPNGTIVILIQNGEAEIGRWEEPTPPENPMPSFDHPINTKELKAEVLQIVLKNHPNINLYGGFLCYVCPKEMASKAIWQN